MTTLMNLINGVLVDMGRSPVNQLGATSEAARVEAICRDIYEHLLTRNLWPNKHKLTKLESISDTSRPSALRIPPGVIRVEEVRYDVRRGTEPQQLRKIDYMEPARFLSMVSLRDSTQPDIHTSLTEDGVPLLIERNSPPRWWTTFDDSLIYFDAYESSEMATMVGGRSTILAYTKPEWPISGDDELPIPEKYLPMYEALARSACHAKIRQEVSPVDDYWGKATYARFLHEGRIAGSNETKRPRYGRRR